MVEGVSVVRINGTHLVSVSSSIPDPVQELVVAVEVASIVSQSIVCDCGLSSEMDGNLLHFSVASGVVDQTQIAKPTPFVDAVHCIVAWTIELKPKDLVDARILSCITTLTRDPERALRVSETDILTGINVANLEADQASNVLAKVVCHCRIALEGCMADGLASDTVCSGNRTVDIVN